MAKNEFGNRKTQEERITTLEGMVLQQSLEIQRLRNTIDKLWRRWQKHDNEAKRARKEKEKKLSSEKKEYRQKVSETENNFPEKELGSNEIADLANNVNLPHTESVNEAWERLRKEGMLNAPEKPKWE